MTCNEPYSVQVSFPWKKFCFKDFSFVYHFPCVSITQYFFPGLSVGFINLLYLWWKTLEQVSSPLWLIFSDDVQTVVLLFSCLTQLFSFTCPLSLPCFFFLPVTFSVCQYVFLSFYLTFSPSFPLLFCFLYLSYFFFWFLSVCLSVYPPKLFPCFS